MEHAGRAFAVLLVTSGAMADSVAALAFAHVGAPGDRIGAALVAGTPLASGSTQTLWVGIALASSGCLYAVGVLRLWRATTLGRGIHVLDCVAFAAGWVALAVAMMGPLDAWAAHSFAAHMLQHELLMLVAAPLLVLGRPLAAWTWALSGGGRRRARALIAIKPWRRAWRFVTQPLGATLVQLVALFVWHLPALFDLAGTHASLHALQHASFLATALCFWWATTTPLRRRPDAPDNRAGVSLACLFVTMIATGALGALLTFAPTPWYREYGGVALPWAASALEDQQLGGLLMWVPGGAVYLVVGLLHAWQLLSRTPEPSRRMPMTATSAPAVR